MESEKEKKALLAKLTLVGKIMELHEWSVFGQKEAEDVERAETKIDSEASGSATEPPEAE